MLLCAAVRQGGRGKNRSFFDGTTRTLNSANKSQRIEGPFDRARPPARSLARLLARGLDSDWRECEVNVLRSPAYVYGRTLFNNALLRTLTRYSGRTWCLDTHPRAPTRARARVHTLRAYECVFRARVCVICAHVRIRARESAPIPVHLSTR